MNYLSTRGDATPRAFCDILLEGLAPDGGLYLPERYPPIDAPTLAAWRHLPYADLAFEILSLYIDDIPADDLRALVARTYTPTIFGTREITPLVALEPGLHLQALSNGPTLAFKDLAMQLLGTLFEYELRRRGEHLNILGATSGDTGSAAEYAMRGKEGVAVFMLSPAGRMSAFQQAQMFSLADANIHNLTIAGVFDDCQDIVKAVSNDLDFKRLHRIGTVNSINWARLLAQVVYYFAGYFQATTSNDERVAFAVPSGNFGNICAGHVARMMGLPIARLVLATNENDVLDEFFRTGTYRVRSGAETLETSSPSMDISKASNFERFVFDLLGRDAPRTRELFGARLAGEGAFTLPDDEIARIAEFGFVSGSSTHADRIDTIRDTWERFGTMIDTHTADGLKVAREHLLPGVPMVVLETAQPVKFAETIVEALGRAPVRPEALEGIEDLPKRFTALPSDAAAVKAYIERHALGALTDGAPRRAPPAHTAPPLAAVAPLHAVAGTAASKPALMSLDDALARLLAAVQPLPADAADTVATFDALGRVLADDVRSTVDVPPEDNSAMDGYALRAADVAAAGTLLPVSQRIAAGRPGTPLAAGSAARIFTGAQIPTGADTVVMQEQCAAQGESVRIDSVPSPGLFIRRRGDDIAAGAVVLPRGARLTPQALGVAAAAGAAALRVARRPRVALFSTGDELAMPGEPLAPGAIYNSNRFLLRGLLQTLGCECTDLGIVPDRLDATRDALRRAAEGSDLILTCGGVSVGEEDHLRPAVESEGRLDLWQMAIKPGKPLAFGAVRRGDGSTAYFVGLPGNPVSSFVTFLLIVRPLLLKLQGATDLAPVALDMRADFDLPRADRRREFLRARRNAAGGLDLFANQDSGVLTSTVWADGLIDNPPHTTVARGDRVRFLPFAELLR